MANKTSNRTVYMPCRLIAHESPGDDSRTGKFMAHRNCQTSSRRTAKWRLVVLSTTRQAWPWFGGCRTDGKPTTESLARSQRCLHGGSQGSWLPNRFVEPQMSNKIMNQLLA